MIKNHGSDPATLHYAVVASNTVPLDPTPRALYIESDGSLTIVDNANVSVTYTVTAGQVLPFRPVRIHTDSSAEVVAWL